MQQAFHRPGIACQNDNQAFAVVFHAFEQGLNGFVAVGVASFVADKAVGFVDEQHAVEGLVDLAVRFGRGLPRILGDQPRAIGFNQMASGENAHAREDATDEPRHGGFARSRVALKHHVQADARFG